MNRKAKSLLSLALALLLLLTLLPGSVLAANVASGSCGADGSNVTWSLDSAGVMTISGTGAMADYTWDTQPWYDHMNEIKSVKIASGVTAVGAQAFNSCVNLASVSFPSSLTSIGNGAFLGTALKSVSIPASVDNIGLEAFRQCLSLTEINVNANNKTYTSVDGVLFTKDKTKIISYPCGKSGTSYTIPSTVTVIGTEPFAFSNLESLTIPASVTEIEPLTFIFCVKMKEYKVNSANPNFTSVNGVLFSKDKQTLYAYPAGNTASSYTIPSSVTYVWICAFHCASWLQSVTIPNSVKQIDMGAFMYCTSLRSAVLPDGLQTISIQCFAYDTSLTSVKFPGTVKDIGYSAFVSCSALTDVYYGGNEAAWKTINIQTWNDPLDAATKHYNAGGYTTPLTASIWANVSSAYVGDTITWTASATGSGTLQYCFYVYKDNTIIKKGSYGSGSSVSFKISEEGDYAAKVFVKDASGSVSVLSSPIYVGKRPGADLRVSFQTPVYTSGYSEYIEWFVDTYGGDGTEQFCFYVYKDGKIVEKGSYGPDSAYYYAPKAVGVYTAKVFVRNSAVSVSAVSDPVSVEEERPDPLELDSVYTTAVWGDSTITWYVNHWGGDSTEQFCFYVYKDGRIVEKGSYGPDDFYSFTPQTAGNYTAKAFAKNSYETVSKMSDPYYWEEPYYPLYIMSVWSAQSSAPVGESVTWYADVGGGNGTEQYCFYVYQNGRIVHRGSYGTDSFISYVLPSPGIYTAKAFVKDDRTSVNMMSGEVIAEASLSVDIWADRISALVGDEVLWTAQLSGGSGTEQVCFYVYKDGRIFQKGSYGAAADFRCQLTEPGTYTAKVFVKGSNGTTTAMSDTVTVTVPMEIDFWADRITAVTGETINWAVTVNGGFGAIQYCYYVYRNGRIVQKGSYCADTFLSYAPTQTGTYQAKVFIKDSTGSVTSYLGPDTVEVSAPTN